ncbi:hypothetical protein KY330_05930 [Candidatus Woesearchaeota archaeon]|nr:hypothetical protein [Candidatus Woesearchaeota archaeon]
MEEQEKSKETHDHETDAPEQAPEQRTVEKTEDEIRDEMDSGLKNEDVYSEEGRENMLDSDQLSYEEEGFMEGAEGRGQLAKCDECHKILDTDNKSAIIEREFNGDMYHFCSEKCAEKYALKKEQA